MKSFYQLLFSLLFASTMSGSAGAQVWFQKASLGAQFHYGSFLTNAPKAEYVKDSYSTFGEVYAQWQTDGSQQWHIANRRPQWGAGLFGGNTGSRQYIGHMGGAFTFIQLPLLRAGTVNSHLRLAGGVAWVEKPYNKISNHKNVLIGTYLNGYINLLWQNEIRLARTTYLTAGISFSHLSNGGSTLPNMGLNVPAVSVGVRHGVALPKQVAEKVDPLNRKVLFKLSSSFGWKQIPWIGSPRYLTNVLSAEVSRPLSASGAFGGGVLVLYDRSLQVDPTTITSNKRDISKIQGGVYAAYEHNLGRVTIPLQVGAMIYNKDVNPVVFEQLGIRYQFARQWWGQLQLKSYGGRADLLHAGIGYTFQ